MLARVIGEHAIDQRLIPDLGTLGFCSEMLQDIRIETDRDQLTGGVANRGTTTSVRSLRREIVVSRSP